MSKIDLLLDEENELTFQLNIEGSSPGAAKCRLKLENKEVDLLFEARSFNKGEVSVFLPPLAHMLKEGEYDMTLEVVVDDKFFEPLKVVGSFEKNVKVTAEAVVRQPARKRTSVTATIPQKTPAPPISVKSSKSRQKTIVETKKHTKNTKRRNISDQDILRLIETLKTK